MAGSAQREWAIDILEALPSAIFVALWRSNVNMELAGWAGTLMAATLLIGFRYFHVKNNPIMLGINVHLLIVTPLIMAAFYLGARDFSDMLVAHSYCGVLVSIFLVGLGLAVFSKNGFIGVAELPAADRRKSSMILLGATGLAVIWAMSSTGGTVVAVAVPIVGLFALRRFLIARNLDRGNHLVGLTAAGLGSSALAQIDTDGV